MTQRQSQVRVLSMKKFAEICRTTPRTLRFYDQKGLLKPAEIDEFTGYRYYTQEQARDFLKIRFAQAFDLQLKSIKIAKENKFTTDLISEQIENLKKDMEEKKKKLDFLEKMNSLLFQNQSLKNVFKKETIEPLNLFSFKVNGDYSEIIKYRESVRNEAKKLKIDIRDEDLVVYLDSKYHPKNTPLEISVICRKDLSNSKLPEGFSFRKFPKTQVYSYDYQGPENYLILLYQRLFDLLIENKIKLPDQTFELYIEDSDAKLSQFDKKIKLCFPI